MYKKKLILEIFFRYNYWSYHWFFLSCIWWTVKTKYVWERI